MSKGMRIFVLVCGILVGTGIILGILGAVLGGIKGLSQIEENVPWISFGGSGVKETQTVSTGDFSAVNVDCDLAEVQLVEGKQFGVELEYDKKANRPAVSVENGVLTVESFYKRGRWFNFNLFSIGSHVDTVIRIVYPKDSSFEAVELNADAGDIGINSLTAKRVTLEVDAGNVSIRKLNTDYLKIDADMGDVAARSVKTNGIDISMDMGAVDLEGALGGKTKITCNMGDCSLTTGLPKNSYSVNSNVDLGSCTIDGQEAGSSYINTNEGAKNYLNLNCDAGDLDIRFQ